MRRLVLTFAGVFLLAAPVAAAERRLPPPTTPASQAAAAQSGPLARTDVNPRGRGIRVPRSFLGFSAEWGAVQALVGLPGLGVNDVYTRVVAPLSPPAAGPVTLRVGGNSSDEVWFNPTGAQRPFGVRGDVLPEQLRALKASHAQTGSPMIIGLNLAIQNPQIAIDLAKASVAELGRSAIKAFEVGNEPDIYPEKFFAQKDGKDVKARPKSWGFGDHVKEFERYLKELSGATGGVPLAGPAAVTDGFLNRFKPFLRRFARRMGLVTYHRYSYSACAKSGPDAPSLPKLLSDRAVFSTYGRMLPVVAEAQRYRRKVRLSETQSTACGGKPGITDTFAQALWTLDYAFVGTVAGLAGMDFHTSGNDYAPFVFGHDGSYKVAIQPMYYGLLSFIRATAGAKVLLEPTPNTKVRRGANVHVWATVDRSGTVRIVAVNKDRGASGPVEVRIRGRRGAGELERLVAPSVTATDGITLGGQGFPDIGDGTLQGERVTESITPRGSTYRFDLPRTSAAMLTVSR